MINISNKIKNYNDMIYDTRPVQVSEYLSDKYNIIHKQLFNDAVTSYLNLNNIDKNEFYQNNKIFELKNNEYWQPSKLVILSKQYENGFAKHIIDLTPFWNTELSFKDKTYKTIKFSKDNINDFEIIYIDYIKGKATIKSKLTDKEYKIDFDDIDSNMNVSSDIFISNDTWSQLYNSNK